MQKKDNKIKFECFIPELIDQNIVSKISLKDFKWHEKARKYYKKNNSLSHISKCPGIIKILNSGWVQKAYQDIKIETNGDRISYKVQMSFDQSQLLSNALGHYIHIHDEKDYTWFNEAHEATMKTIIKVQSPWVVFIPHGYGLFQTSVPHSDYNFFSAASGILTESPMWMNIQLFWHNIKGQKIIKKGTPLCYYQLIKLENIDESYEVIKSETINQLNQHAIKSNQKAEYIFRRKND